MRWNYYKLRQLSLLQSAMDSYYKLRQLFYYRVRHGLLQIATGITKCDDYYKLRQYSPPYLIKNERSLNHIGMVRKHNSAVILFKTCLLGAMLLKSINELYRRATYNDQETPSCVSFSRKVTPGP